jgi:hypothetical protein
VALSEKWPDAKKAAKPRGWRRGNNRGVPQKKPPVFQAAGCEAGVPYLAMR